MNFKARILALAAVASSFNGVVHDVAGQGEVMEMDALQDQLLGECPFLQSYNWPIVNTIPPQPVNVTFQLRLIKFWGIDDSSASISIIALTDTSWQLPQCATWQETPLTPLLRFEFAPATTDRLWFPGIIQQNSAEDIDIMDHLYTDSNQLLLHPDGTASVEVSAVFSAFCTDFGKYLVKFPFDTQTCTIRFQSKDDVKWVQITSQLINQPNPNQDELLPEEFVDSGEGWGFVSVVHTSGQTEVFDTHLGNLTVSSWEYTFTFNRKPQAVIFGVFAPCTSLMALQIGVYTIPARLPERCVFAMTILLAFYIIQTIVDSMVPETSMFLYIKIYILGQIIMGAAVVIYCVVVCKYASMYHKKMVGAHHKKHKEDEHKKDEDETEGGKLAVHEEHVAEKPFCCGYTYYAFVDVIAFIFTVIFTIGLNALTFGLMVDGPTS